MYLLEYLMGIKSGIMRKEIFNKELIEKYRDENGWISAIYKPEEFFNDSEKKRREVTVIEKQPCYCREANVLGI